MESWKEKLIAKFASKPQSKTLAAESANAIQPKVPAYCTQYPGPIDGRETIQLVIGLDFGTAYTKVVIGERRRAYAVPFPELCHNGNPYLLPGVLTVAEDGRVRLGANDSGRRVSNLKMRILDGDTGDETLSIAVSFIALVLQHARGWFMNTHRQTYERYNLDWNVNVGLPTAHYQDEPLADFYRQIVMAAWHASTRTEPLDIDAACNSFADDEGVLAQHAVGTFPEFAAQINGYVRSPMRRSDLHLLMDVGAGTVDVAMFNVHQKDGDDVFPVFAGIVKHLGVRMLLKHRVEKAGRDRADRDTRHIEDVPDVYAARALGVTIDELRMVDKPFRAAVFAQVRNVVRLTKPKYPRSPHWREGVPFFLCGGGAHAELYARLAELMAQDSAPCPLVRLELPRPDRLVADRIDDADYDRLSVAYGLSFDQFEVGQIVLPNNIEDLEGQSELGHVRGAQCPACNGSGGYMANSCGQCGGSGWIA